MTYGRNNRQHTNIKVRYVPTNINIYRSIYFGKMYASSTFKEKVSDLLNRKFHGKKCKNILPHYTGTETKF